MTMSSQGKNCQFYLAKRQLRGVKNCLFWDDIVYGRPQRILEQNWRNFPNGQKLLIIFYNLSEETSVIYTLWIWGRQPLADGHFGLFSQEISMLFFDSSMQLSPLVFQGHLLILKDNESNLKVMSLEIKATKIGLDISVDLIFRMSNQMKD